MHRSLPAMPVICLRLRASVNTELEQVIPDCELSHVIDLVNAFLFNGLTKCRDDVLNNKKFWFSIYPSLCEIHVPDVVFCRCGVFSRVK